MRNKDHNTLLISEKIKEEERFFLFFVPQFKLRLPVVACVSYSFLARQAGFAI